MMGTKNYANAADLVDFTRASTGTYLDKDGTLKTAAVDVPRIEYNADGTLKGLLIEEQQTNLVTYSEDFSNASWVTLNATAPAIDATGPDGQTSAVTLVDSGATGTSTVRIYRDFSVTTSTAYTFSIYAKADQLSWIDILALNFTTPTTSQAYFDLSNGVKGTIDAGFSSSSIEAIGNGWYRCSVTFTTDAADNLGRIEIRVAEADGDAVVDLDGTSSILIYGAQLEEGSFPTSYIPTEGSQATRAADICNIDTDQFGYNQKEGTVVVEFDSNGSDGADYPRVFSLSNSAGTDLSRFLINPLNTTTVAVIKSSVGVALTGWSGSISPNAAEKVAVSMKKDSFAASLSGASSQTDTSGDMPAAADLLSIGTQSNLANNYLNGHIKSIDYYPRRLTNEQLQELTS